MSETVHVEQVGNVEISFTERGSGRPVVVLHGGAGPMSVVPWAELLASTRPARVITPTHPGFMATPRPDALTDIPGVARAHAALIRKLGLGRVALIGNSIGGWIAAELALHAPELVDKLVLVDAVGIDVPGHPVADVFSMPLDELARRSYHDPVRFRIDPTKLTPEQKAVMAANFATLRLYGGGMADAGLRPRLQAIAPRTLVVWGEADRIADHVYGRAYADAIPGARFQLLAGTGHVPQVETPALLADTIWPFLAT